MRSASTASRLGNCIRSQSLARGRMFVSSQPVWSNIFQGVQFCSVQRSFHDSNNSGQQSFQQPPPPPAQPQTVPDPMFELGDEMVVTVNEFKGHVIIHLRQYFYPKDSQERKPSKRGVTLRAADFNQLEQLFDDIEQQLYALSSETGDFDKKYDFSIGKNRKVSVHMRQSIPYVKFEQTTIKYGPQGGTIEKDVELTGEQYSMLKYLYPTIKETIASVQQTVKTNSTVYQTKLSDWTNASVINLDGKHFVDIRKNPNPGGQLAGQQGQNFVRTGGIAIRISEWETLVSHIQSLNDALYNGDLNFRLPLNTNRMAHLNFYKESWYVVIREYFTPAGSSDLLPTKKGINLRVEEWQALCHEMPNLTGHLQQALASSGPSS